MVKRYSKVLCKDTLYSKVPIHQEDTNLCVYTPNIGAPKCRKQKITELKGEINSNTDISGDLIPYSQQWMHHPGRESIRKQWT